MRRLCVIAALVCSAPASAWAQPGHIELEPPATSERWYVLADLGMSLFNGGRFSNEFAKPNAFLPSVHDSFSAEYDLNRALGGSYGGGVMVTSRLGFGVTRSRVKYDEVPVATSTSRPRLFRNSAGTIYASGWFTDSGWSSSERIERAYHVELSGVVIRTRALFVRALAGPSYFDTAQGLIKVLEGVDARVVEQTSIEGTGWGYHAGVDVATYFSNAHNSSGLGFGTTIRYARADVNSINALDPAGSPQKYAVGGWQVTAGVRGRF